MPAAGTPHTRVGGYPMRASSAQITWSAKSAMSLPPATANPWIFTTVGLSACSSAANPRLKRLIMA